MQRDVDVQQSRDIELDNIPGQEQALLCRTANLTTSVMFPPRIFGQVRNAIWRKSQKS